jgi:hypothetical protein
MPQVSDYKAPFRKLKTELRAIWDLNQSLYHAVLFSPTSGGSHLGKSIDLLEPAIEGKVTVATVLLPSNVLAHHAHYFFGSKAAYDRLWHVLDGVEGWMSAIPRQLVPEFDLPRISHHGSRNAALWASLVYYLAWKADVAYLQPELECQEQANDTYFYRWPEFPQPPEADPRYLLIHQKVTENPAVWKSKFEQANYKLPEVVDAYFESDFILNSLAAVDILLSLDQEDDFGEGTNAPPLQLKPIQSKKVRSKKIEKEVKKLRAVLVAHHHPDNVDNDNNLVAPLTGYEIAQKMGWESKGVNRVPSRVTRRMQVIFGPEPMAAYARLFIREARPDGFVMLCDDGTSEIVSYRDYNKEMNKLIEELDAPE